MKYFGFFYDRCHFTIRHRRFLYFVCVAILSIFIFRSFDFSTIFSLAGIRSSSKITPPRLIGYEIEDDDDDTIYILFWTSKWGNIEPDEKINNCVNAPSARCLKTSSRKYLNRSSALLFFARSLHLFKDVPKLKYLHQKYVFLNYESPLHTRVPLEGAVQKDFFDWTMTYRRDSTIYCPDAYFESINHTITSPQLRLTDYFEIRSENQLETRPKLIAWVVSHCATGSKREHYVYRLQKYIQVDIYGRCGAGSKKSCPRNEANRCIEMLSKNYKFYLGFENAICTDYVTEKYAHRLALNFVIIVLRRRDYESIVPTFPDDLIDENFTDTNFNGTFDRRSISRWQNLRNRHKKSWYFFVAADDFENPRDLANYIYFLDQNPNEYLRYFEWRKYWKVLMYGDRYCLCDLCSKLYHERDRLRKIEKERIREIEKEQQVSKFDIHQWWNVGTCIIDFAANLAKKS